MEDQSIRWTIIQCANRKTLTLEKAKDDMRKAFNATTRKPDSFKFVCRGTIPDTRRTQITEEASKLGVTHVTIWSGVEFEENLRLRAEYLLSRFVQGIEFPEAEADIRKFVDDFPGMSDAEVLELIAVVFDRPAFRTPFQLESSLPAFLQAIEDTIGALNTGIWKTRDGTEIRRIPTIHHLREQQTRSVLKQVILQVDELRDIFVTGLRDGRIQHCQCGQEDCPVYMLSRQVAKELDQARNRILMMFKSVHAPFDVQLR